MIENDPLDEEENGTQGHVAMMVQYRSRNRGGNKSGDPCCGGRSSNGVLDGDDVRTVYNEGSGLHHRESRDSF